LDFKRPERCRWQRTGREDRRSKFYEVSDNLHLLLDGETVPNAGSRRHRVLPLDVAYLSFKRARQVDFEGWNDRSKRRALRLIYTQGAGASVAAEQKALAEKKLEPEPPSMPPTMSLFGDEDGAG